MPSEPEIKPLPIKQRRFTFIIAVLIFVGTLPFFYLYATGYRFDFGAETALVSTGGMYIAAERTGADIFIDDELVRETRVFRRAFYAQNLEPTTHKVSVQKDGHHTWVKELPVYPHLVTEAQAFNMPLIPQVRVISKWQTATGSAVVDPSFAASSTNSIVATSTMATSTLELNDEYDVLLELFATSAPTTTSKTRLEDIASRITLGQGSATTTATSSLEHATTTKEWRGVKLYEQGEDVYAAWVGSREDIPYYYCAEPFERYQASSTEATSTRGHVLDMNTAEANTATLDHPVQTVDDGTDCDPTIRLDRKWQTVSYFDFFPGSTDMVVLVIEDGVYAIEIDNRAWQNMQPLYEGTGLDARVENGQIYVYDGEYIYQIVLDE